MADLDEKMCFTINWRIENFSLFLSERNGQIETSPIFRTDATQCNEELKMELNQCRNVDNEDLVVVRIKKSETGNSRGNMQKICLSDCELYVVKHDGSSLGNFKKYKYACSTEIDFKIPQTEIFFNKCDTYIPNDTLILDQFSSVLYSDCFISPKIWLGHTFLGILYNN